MTPQVGTWFTYGGNARIWLTIGLLAAASAVIFAGIRLPLPVRASRRPGSAGAAAMVTVWVISILAFLVCVANYIQQDIKVYPNAPEATPKDRIAPITFTAALVVLVVILVSRRSPRFRTRLASGLICAVVGPMIFELPFDLMVMARTYPPIPPHPALYRVLFFAPLFLVEITTLLLLLLSPMVRLTRATFFSFALMLGVFGVWVLLDGLSFPSSALPYTMNVVSKILAFVTALTLFLPYRPAPEQAPGPDRNGQARPASLPVAAD
jgi:hypothetical protein